MTETNIRNKTNKDENCFQRADILIPNVKNDKINLTKWSVIACDQYTSDIGYWNKTKELVGDSPSCLHFIIPEVYLETETEQQKELRIEQINKTMLEYSNSNDMFCCYENCFIYVERTLKNGKVRCGIIGKVDLERYDYSKNSTSEIHATESTVEERIPPRIKIRKNAAMESPHILLLFDDKNNSVISSIQEKKEELPIIYDFDLMNQSGSIKGYMLRDGVAADIEDKINKIKTGNIKFAVGDGNHSLATAKECYELLKTELSEAEYLSHPARYALVEAVNIYDTSLDFEPIYRVVFEVNPEHLIEELKKSGIMSDGNTDKNLKVFYQDKLLNLSVDISDSKKLVVDTLQQFLDNYIKTFGGKIDYIHGLKETVNLSKNNGNIGFAFDTITKDDLFNYVSENGTLQRKTFSMGEADDKRFYLECRKIIK